jgi:endo-1,4-beta-xylanase
LLTRADYAETAGREFNVLVAENDMKFGPIHPARGRYAYCAADDILAFAEANQMKVRGHTLVWHQQNPRWLDEGTFTREELLEVMREHISTVMGRYKGRVFAWDVVNESFAYGPPYGWMPSIWQRVLGTPDYIDAAFRFAREADPDALLFYNETGAETPGAKADRVYELLKGMKERGVPLDGVGFQMHVEALRPPSREALMRNFARFAELGIEIHVTEMDVRSPLPATAEKLDAEARVYRDVTAVCRATPRCTAILTWGVTDAISWIPGLYPNHLPGLLFDAAYQPKPSYQAVKDILGQN